METTVFENCLKSRISSYEIFRVIATFFQLSTTVEGV